jgi:hypothetical protein
MDVHPPINPLSSKDLDPFRCASAKQQNTYWSVVSGLNQSNRDESIGIIVPFLGVAIGKKQMEKKHSSSPSSALTHPFWSTFQVSPTIRPATN